MDFKESKLPVPRYIRFTQKIAKLKNGFIIYELHLFSRMVFRYSGKASLKECFEMRDQWLRDNKN